MPDAQPTINLSALAQCYREHYNAAYNLLSPEDKQFLKKEQEGCVTWSIRLFAKRFYSDVIDKAEAKFFKVKRETPKVEIKLITSDEIMGGESGSGELVPK